MTTLHEVVREAQSLSDQSNGRDSVYDVLKALVGETSAVVNSGLVALPTTAVIASFVAPRATRLGSMALRVGTTGSSGTTTAVVKVAGSAVSGATLSVANTEANGTSKVLDLQSLDSVVPAGALVEIALTAVGGSAANVIATLALEPVKVEVP